MAGCTFILGCGGMPAFARAILIPAVALCTQLGRFRLEAGIFTYAVSEMAGQAITFFHGVMHTLRLAVLTHRMTFQTYCCRRSCQHARLFTGMHTMALRALAFLNRLMLPSERGLILFMTLNAEQIGILRGLGKIRPGPVMAASALAGKNRLMDNGFQQTLLVAGMGVVTA